MGAGAARTLVLTRPAGSGRFAPDPGRPGSRDPAICSGTRVVMTSSTNLAGNRPPLEGTSGPLFTGVTPGAEAGAGLGLSPPPSPPPEISDAEGPPDAFNCPIGHALMTDPVTCADGHSYERENIEHWLQLQKTSPLTGVALPHLHLTPNHALRKAIDEWKQERKDSLQVKQAAMDFFGRVTTM